jgi:hypothetical protein
MNQTIMSQTRPPPPSIPHPSKALNATVASVSDAPAGRLPPPPPPRELRPEHGRPEASLRTFSSPMRENSAARNSAAAILKVAPPGARPVRALKAVQNVNTDQRGPPKHEEPPNGIYRPAASWARDMDWHFGQFTPRTDSADHGGSAGGDTLSHGGSAGGDKDEKDALDPERQRAKMKAEADARSRYIGSCQYHETKHKHESVKGLVREGVPAPPANRPRLFRPTILDSTEA